MFEKHLHSACIETALINAESLCEKNSLRLTDLRRKVLEIIWANHGPVKAYDILDQLGDESGSAKPPTVYRTLDFLAENGFVHKLNSLNSYVGCSHPSQLHACYFLICEKCSEVKECCNEQLNQAIKDTADSNKFKSSHITLEIQGVCEHCA